MFNRLIVSTSERRKSRTARFFFATSIIYLSAIAAAFALSVLVSDPKLADSAGHAKGVMISHAPPVGGGPRARTPQQLNGARPDFNHVTPLETIHERPATTSTAAASFLRPPTGGDFVAGGPPGPGGGDRDSPGGPPGLGDRPGIAPGQVEPPPPPERRAQTPPPPQADKTPVRVSTQLLQGKAIERRTPPYPQLAKQIRLEGAVSVEVVISPEGQVEQARAVSGHPMLIMAAVDAARGWRFQPTILNGIPVRVTGVITFVFKLGE
jgi:protein TonB